MSILHEQGKNSKKKSTGVKLIKIQFESFFQKTIRTKNHVSFSFHSHRSVDDILLKMNISNDTVNDLEFDQDSSYTTVIPSRLFVSTRTEYVVDVCHQTEQMPFTIFGLANARTFDLIESYAQTLQMPFILPSCYRKSDVKKQFTICMNPSYIKPIADFIVYFRWKRVSFSLLILHRYSDHDKKKQSKHLTVEMILLLLSVIKLLDHPLFSKGLWRLEQLYEELESLKVQISLVARRIPNTSFAYDILRSIDKIGGCEEKLIVLDLSHKNNTVLLLRQFLDKFMSNKLLQSDKLIKYISKCCIIDVGMNRYGYHYIIGGLSKHHIISEFSVYLHWIPLGEFMSYNLSIFRHGGSTISGFQLLNTNDEYFTKFYQKWIVEINGRRAPELTAFNIMNRFSDVSLSNLTDYGNLVLFRFTSPN
ncbi:LOW QUALITY PROTEIN: hypothetical protein KUTeg_024900 [Tegillarca granosa]|uniref:Receptor ligand binding region domain-containing protein n=1 Tax=Tegillarca granosa TaxID=220873 RepID=A0ABQ9DYJ6_TEGGR|nr:LOW QUALITY PROTEIN: hypothetical protein KUTeg_024900 [Tegillarca granosa]